MRLTEVIGRGGMGAVYKAVHVNLKKVVAVKILTVQQKFPSAIERFYQEMQAIGRLDHPNLVRATDAGEDQGRHFLVMDYVEGEDLGKILRAAASCRGPRRRPSSARRPRGCNIWRSMIWFTATSSRRTSC